MREAMAPAMVRGSGPGPSLPEACALGLLAPLEELHRPQGHHGARPARKLSGRRGPPAASMGREDPVPGAEKESCGAGLHGRGEQSRVGTDGVEPARRSGTPAGDTGVT